MHNKECENPANRTQDIMRKSGKIERRLMAKKRISSNRKPLPLIVLCLITLGASFSAYGSHRGKTHSERDFVTAFDKLQSLAERGGVFAQVKLGDMYNYGRGVRQDFKEAVKWYRLAAEQGNADAHAGLGVMYDGGYGVSQDYEKAVHCYRFAAKQGDTLSQYFLGVSYTKGEGVPVDNIRAYMWFDIAASQGLADAIQYRAILSKQMNSNQIAEAKHRTLQ